MATCAINVTQARATDASAWPAWWKSLVIALAVLSLCSCRGFKSGKEVEVAAPYERARSGGDTASTTDAATTSTRRRDESPATKRDWRNDGGTSKVSDIEIRRHPAQVEIRPVAHNEACPPEMGNTELGNTLPPSAFTGSPEDGLGPDGRPLGGPLLPWAPPGIARPWPHDEYLRDGGDARSMAIVQQDWRIDGLEPEDTLAHYETTDGRTLIAPSNQVKLYAPRFAAVRRLSLVNSLDQEEFAFSARRRREAAAQQQPLPSSTVMQPRGARGEIGRKNLIVQQQNAPPLLVDNQKEAAEAINRYKPFEDFAIIRIGQFVEAEKAQLAVHIDAANVWTRDQTPMVTINNRKAVAAVADQKAQITYSIDDERTPCLRLIKVASTDVARPGDIVEFTLRYDNVGDDVVGNVTIVDSLTPRLEYVADSAASSAKSTFSSSENEAGSLVLRWEITNPVKAGDGGILRFKCRVR